MADQGLTTRQVIPEETAGGLIHLTLEDDDRVTVDMGEPYFQPESLPFDEAAPRPE